MKRKPCTKVPIPGSPKKRLRTSSNLSSKDGNRQTRADIGQEEEDIDSQQEIVTIKAKSPFYKKVLDQPQGHATVRACAKKITYTDKDVQRPVEPGIDALEKRGPVKSDTDENEPEAEKSGISLNSSYLTLSTADSSSLSQESTETCSQDRFSNSQSSKDEFTFSKTSDNSDQLDYNDTLTSGEPTPNRSLLSPRERTFTRPGKMNSSVSSKSENSSPAVEVVIERDIVEFIDCNRFDDDHHKCSTEFGEPQPNPVRTERNEAVLKVGDKAVKKTVDYAVDGKKDSLINTKIVVSKEDKNDRNKDENNNTDEMAAKNQTTDQVVMSKTYQNAAGKASVNDELRDTNNNVTQVQHKGISDQDVMSNSYQSSGLEEENLKDQVGMGTEPLAQQNNNNRKDETLPGPPEAKEPTVSVQTFSEVMPHDLEPRQLIQMRQDPSCLLSPITEENAVERVAKELVNTYGGQNSHRIPEILRDHGRLPDYDYNSSFGSSLPYPQSRDPRLHYPQQQAHQSADYLAGRSNLLRDPIALQNHNTNGISFGEPQGSSTPELFQRKPICFSPDDFPSPYHYDVPPSNHNWLGGSGNLNHYQPNSKQPDYFLSENPLGGTNFTLTGQQRNCYHGKGIMDLPGSGDYRPAPKMHDNTTMTFTPRALMESHLSGSYFTSSHSSSGLKQSCFAADGAPYAKPSLRNMDCSSIYPSREFIEKNSGSYRTATPAKVPSYENLVPPPKKRKLKSLSETDIDNEKDLSGCHLSLPPFEAPYGPPRHKYYVVNPSDATAMAPRTLIAKYIDFLILENEQITEISKSISQPVDIYVTEDMYFMDTLKHRVPFPSKKFIEWSQSFYPKLRLENMRFPGVKGKHKDIPRGEDRRPTQQVLEDIFYYFQRQVMNLYD